MAGGERRVGICATPMVTHVYLPGERESEGRRWLSPIIPGADVLGLMVPRSSDSGVSGK